MMIRYNPEESPYEVKWWAWIFPPILGAIAVAVAYHIGLPTNTSVLCGVLTCFTFVLFYFYLNVYEIIKGNSRPKDNNILESKQENKMQEEKMSKEEFVKLVSERVPQTGKEGEKYFMALSVYFLFYLNKIDDSIKVELSCKCAGAAEEGWRIAGEVLQTLETNGDEWDSHAFDSFITSGFLHKVANEEPLKDNIHNLQLVRWAFNYGAQSRVDYCTMERYREAFMAGNLYDVEICKLDDEEFFQHLDDADLEEKCPEAKMAMSRFKALFQQYVAIIGKPELKSFVSENPDSIGFFFGGLATSSITKGQIDVSNFPDFSDKTKQELKSAYQIYIDKLAGELLLKLHEEHPGECFTIFFIGIYANQIVGDKQIIPFDLNLDTLFKAAEGDTVSRVMTFCDSGLK